MLKDCAIKFTLAIIPFLFIAYFPTSINTNPLQAFGLQVGSIMGIIIGKYITRYGKNNVIIFGGILFSVFAYQYFLNKTSAISVITLIMAGLGYGIICYEIFYKKQLNMASTLLTKQQKILLYIFFIWFYANLGIILICYSFKISYLYGSFITFLTLILYALIIALIQFYQLPKALRINKYWILMITGIWMSAISSEIIVLLCGFTFIAISCGVIFNYHKNVFAGHLAINLYMLIGYTISTICIYFFENIVGFYNLNYLSFVSSIILTAFIINNKTLFFTEIK